jgi:uncharacterized protein
MPRILIIFFSALFLFVTSCGTKPNVKDAKNIGRAKPTKIVFDVSDKTYVDSLLNDSSFVKVFGRSQSLDEGEFVSSAYKIELPAKPAGWTSDYEQLFTKGQVDSLNSLISHFEAETSNEIAVVTIDRRWTTEDKFDSLVTDIGNYWGVGKKGKNNGIVLGISAGLRKIRISNGYGIEAKLSDNESKEIIDSTIIPYFKEGKFYEGVSRGLAKIMQQLR